MKAHHIISTTLSAGLAVLSIATASAQPASVNQTPSRADFDLFSPAEPSTSSLPSGESQPRAATPTSTLEPAQGPASSATRAGKSARSLEDQYFSSPSPRLTPRERKGIAIQERWNGSSTTSSDLPAPGTDGMIRYVFGTVQAPIVCAVLQVCDIELQPGERVQSVHYGDTARWLIAPAITGDAPNEIQHLIVKPTDVGLDTSLVVTTNRRTYHMRLRSHRTQSMVRVGWLYPEDTAAEWAALQKREATQRQTRTIPATNEYLGDLSFEYRVTGDAPWKPIRVYNDGSKTIIQMPSEVRSGEAPALLVVRRDGGLFTAEETAVVNYRVQNDRYIVDQVFDKAILLAGVGASQTRITIEREK